MKEQHYTVKEFALNPSKLIHRALEQQEEVVITLRGVPAVRLVPIPVPLPAQSILDAWEAMADMAVSRVPMTMPPLEVLSGDGPTASEMLLEDRR